MIVRAGVRAGDTFRAGAVEQLRTHVRKLNAAQKQTGRQSTVTLFEKGYGKDAAGIAGDAIAFARGALVTACTLPGINQGTFIHYFRGTECVLVVGGGCPPTCCYALQLSLVSPSLP